MPRTTVTIPVDLVWLLNETGQDTVFRSVLVEWLVEHGQPASVLRSEGGRIRVLLQVAAEALRERALDRGYEEMAQWWAETDPDRRAAVGAAMRREAARWAAEEPAASDGGG